MKGTAFSPGNITLFFGIVEHKDPMKKGSIGVSLAVSKGARVEASRAGKTTLYVNGKKRPFPTVRTAVRFLTNDHVKLSIEAQLPIGCGYGMSGACTLASLYAVNEALGLKQSKKSLALMAHKAEVLHRTGLGSITAEYLGGVLMRKKKGSPLAAERLGIGKVKLYIRSLGKISTERVISNVKLKKRINRNCSKAFGSVGAKSTLASLLQAGEQFGKGTGLLNDKRILRLMDEVKAKGGTATMNMLGKSIVANRSFSGCRTVAVSTTGAKVL